MKPSRAALPNLERVVDDRQRARVFLVCGQLVPDLIQQKGPQAEVGGRVGTVDFDFQRRFRGWLVWFDLLRQLGRELIKLIHAALDHHFVPDLRPSHRRNAFGLEGIRDSAEALARLPQLLDTFEGGRQCEGGFYGEIRRCITLFLNVDRGLSAAGSIVRNGL